MRVARVRSPAAGLLAVFLLGAALVAALSPLSARGWDDLERDTDVYGSERESRYPVDGGLFDIESWDGHYSIGSPLLFRYTSYPSFSSFHFLHLYSSVSATRDERYGSYFFPLYYYRREASGDSFTATPLHLYSAYADSDDYDLRVALLFGASREGTEHRQSLFPVFFRHDDAATDDFSYTLFPAFHFEHATSDTMEETFFISPILLQGATRYSDGGYEVFGLSPLHYISYRKNEDLSLLTPLFYYSDDEETGEYSFWPGFLLGFDRSDSETSQYLLPILYHSYDATGQERSFGLVPLFAYSTSNGDEKASSLISPLTYWKNSSGQGQTRHIGFSPLHYASYRSEESLTLLSPLFYYSDNEETGDYSFWPGLVFGFTRDGSEVSQYLLPLLYHSYDSMNESTSLGVLPLFAYSSERQATRTSFISPVLYLKNRSTDSSQSHLSVSPVHYASLEAGSHSRVITPLAYYHSRPEGTTLVAPFYYGFTGHSSEDRDPTQRRLIGNAYYSHDDNGTRFHLLPVFLSDFSDTETTISVLPLFYYSGRDPESARGASSAFASPIAFYRSRGVDRRGWFLLPGYAYSTSRTGQLKADEVASATNIFLNTAWHFDRQGELSYAHLAPLYFGSYDQESNWHLTPVGYHSRSADSERKEVRRRTVSPLYYSSFRETNRPERRRVDALSISPFHFYSDALDTGTGFEYSTTFWAPLVPLYLHHQNSEGGSSRLLLNTYWDSDSRFVFFPVVFGRNDREANYLHIFPVYFQPQSEPGRTRSFGPLHYYNNDEDGHLLVAGPLINYGSVSDDSRRAQAHVLPLHYTWSYPTHKGRILFPLFVEYEDESLHIHLNALGTLDQSRYIYTPHIPGRNERGEWYFDQDLTLGYGLISLETRTTVGIGDVPEETRAAAQGGLVLPGSGIEVDRYDDGQVDREQGDAPAMTRRGTDREDSRSYAGYSFLFGLAAYQSADTRRHMRVLPLSWFSWDEATSDRVYFIPGAFLSYGRESDHLEYFAVFPGFVPLYGSQRQGQSFIESYLAIAYIREYDADDDRSEHSVLWPIFNHHDSPEASGARLLPLFYHRRNHLEDSSITIAPLYYERNQSGGGFEFLAPVYYRYSNEHDGHRYEQWMALPGVFGSETETSDEIISHQSVLLALYRSSRRERTGQIKDRSSHWLAFFGLLGSSDRITEEETVRNESSTAWLFPLHYQHSRVVRGNNAGYESETWINPLWFHSSRSGMGKEGSWNFLPIPLVYTSSAPDTFHANVALAFDWKNERGVLDRLILTPAFYYKRDAYTHLAPLFFYAQSSARDYLFGPGYYFSSGDEEATWVLPGLVHTSDRHSSHWNLLGLLHTTEDSDDQTQMRMALPLYYHSSGHDQTELLLLPAYYAANNERTNLHVLPVWFSGFSSAEGWSASPLHLWTRDGTDYSLTTPLAYVSRSGDNHSLLLPGYYRSVRGDAGHSTLALNVWYGRDVAREQTTFHILPLFFSVHEPQDTSMFIGGVYYRNTPDYNRWNALYLMDLRQQIDSTSFSMALGTLHYHGDSERRAYHIGPLETRWLMGVETHAEGFDANLLWAYHESQPERMTNTFLPLWYVENDPESAAYFFLPTLSLGNIGEHSGYQLWLLGSLYYSNYDDQLHDSDRAWLMGLAYYNRERPERGYSSHGSAWGMLWRYEEESETDYDSLSVLRVVYSRTRRDDTVYHRVLGIKVYEGDAELDAP